MSTTTVSAPRLTKWGCPDGAQVLAAGAPREDWLQARTLGIGGSDVSAITGLSKYASPYSVWLDKVGLAQEREVTTAMRMGNVLEPIVADLFAEETGLKVRRVGLMRSRSHPIMQVTPDRLTSDGGLLECKTSNGWLAHEWEDGQVPDHAELQVQHALAVTGRSHGWVAGLLDGRELFVRRVERDEELIRSLVDIESRFWETYVVPQVAPPVSRVDNATLAARFSQATPESQVVVDRAELVALRAQYEEAHEAEKQAKGIKDDVAARVRQLAGENEALVDHTGATYFTIKQNGAFAKSRFTTEHPEVAAKFMVPTEELDAKKLAENYPELHAAYRARRLNVPKMKTTTKGGE